MITIDGQKFKLGLFGNVYRFIDGDWIRTNNFEANRLLNPNFIKPKKKEAYQ